MKFSLDIFPGNEARARNRLFAAAAAGDLDAVKAWVKAGGDIEVKDMGPFVSKRIKDRYPEFAKADIHRSGRRPGCGLLHYAVFRNEHMLAFLLENGADPNALISPHEDAVETYRSVWECWKSGHNMLSSTPWYNSERSLSNMKMLLDRGLRLSHEEISGINDCKDGVKEKLHQMLSGNVSQKLSVNTQEASARPSRPSRRM